MDPSRPASVSGVAHCFVDLDLDVDVHAEAGSEPLAVRGMVTIGGDDGHHLARVLRVRVGDVVTIADGCGVWRPGHVAAIAGAAVEWVPDGEVRHEPPPVPSLAVAFAPGKGDKPERVVRQLTELGVDRIRPVTTARTVVRWDAEKAAAVHRRLRRIAREAAMQCRRARLPIVDPPAPLATVSGEPGLILGAHDAPGFRALPVGDPGPWTVLVGPEGGFAPDEIEALGPLRVVAVSPTVLRTETAPVAIAAVLSARRYDDSRP